MFNCFLILALVTPVYTNHNRIAGNVHVMTNQQEWAESVSTEMTNRYTKSESDGRFVQGTKISGYNVWDIEVSQSQFAGSAAAAALVPWSGVQNHPTTLLGYGITDAKITDYGTIKLGEKLIKPLAYDEEGRLVAEDFYFIGHIHVSGDLSINGNHSIHVESSITADSAINHGDNEVVYGITTNGTDYLHADVNLAPFGDGILSQARADSGSIATNVIAEAVTTYTPTNTIVSLNQSVQSVSVASGGSLTILAPSADVKDWVVYANCADDNTQFVLPAGQYYAADVAYTNALKAGVTALYFTSCADGIAIGRQEFKPITVQ